ncbi:hypothetical protein Ahy_B10g102528 [Arachis hypogaea]|uniref:Protein FAR1-RELATED SEQUENCE n=1 Tax=Arachis hypogaea TaxID=3818 RepID=A0A444X1W8_ARAHY|nr:hypothetical protein Ahy_B10g102528 [Arachis hypogaea]
MRSRETQSDMHSVVGHFVLQIPFHDLERSTAKLLIREIFLLFRPILSHACTLKVRSCTLTPTSNIYIISRLGNSQNYWHILHYPEDSIFKCSCLRMESLGIPCDHIVALLVHLDFMKIPMSLVLERWSKNDRSKVRQYVDKGPFCWDGMVTCHNWMLNDLCREMFVLASVRKDQSATVIEKVRSEITRLKHDMEVGPSPPAVVVQSSTLEGCVQDPLVVRHKKEAKERGQRPSHEDNIDEDNYYTPNFREEVDDLITYYPIQEYARYHSQPVGQEENFSPDEEDFQYSCHV